jgi:hypothetical protein
LPDALEEQPQTNCELEEEDRTPVVPDGDHLLQIGENDEGKSSEIPPMTATMLTRMTVSHNAPAIRAPKSGDGSVDVSDGMTGVLEKSVYL